MNNTGNLSISIQGAKLAPIFIFKLVWILQFLLYIFSPYPFHSISFDTWLIIFISVTTVIIGYYTYYFFYSTRPVQIYSKESVYGIINISKTKIERILSILLFLVGIGILGDLLFLSYIIYSYGLDISNIFWFRFFIVSFIANSSEWNILHSFFSYLILLNTIVIIISGIYYCLYGSNKVLVFGPIFLAFLFSLITLQRHLIISNIFYWLASIFYVSFYLHPDERRKSLNKFKKNIFVILIFLAFSILSVIYLRFNIDLGGKGSSSRLLELGVQNVYSYLPGNIVALNNYLQLDSPLKNGAFLFRDILKWLARFGVVEANAVPSKFMEFTNVGVVNMNTYTFIRIFYDDFGIIGLLLFSYVWGLVSSFVVHLYFEEFKLYRLLLVVLILFSLFISFFTFSLHNITMVILLLLLIIIIQYSLNIKYQTIYENTHSVF